jgi:hypothetical protein
MDMTDDAWFTADGGSVESGGVAEMDAVGWRSAQAVADRPVNSSRRPPRSSDQFQPLTQHSTPTLVGIAERNR